MTTITPIPAGDILRDLLHPNQPVLVLVTRVNSMGDRRWMRVVVNIGGVPTDITDLVGRLLAERVSTSGIGVSGGGMDLRAHLLENLAHALWGYGNGRLLLA